MFVRANAAQAFEHLEPFERHSAFGAKESESRVLHIECVCKTAPAPRLRTIARCSPVSAEGRPFPRTTRAASSISRNCSAASAPLSNPVGVIARRSGRSLTTALKFPLVPKTHPRW